MAGTRICVIGAGLSGLAATRALSARGFDVECLERGSAVGGLWRYENDNGMSGAYAALRTNASRRRMQYPSFPMPRSYGHFVRHTEMAAYMEAFARAFGLERHIRFRTTVERAEPADGGWRVRTDDGDERTYDALVVASGVYREPWVPSYPGEFGGETLHSRAYRTPEPFTGRRVVVVGAGQSALEIAAGISTVAARTVLTCRRGGHILPRYLLGRPFDHFDLDVVNLPPLPVVRANLRLMSALAGSRVDRGDLPEPGYPLLEETWPTVATDEISAALGSRAVDVKLGIERLLEDGVRFRDGTEERVDVVVYATGYRMSFPFLPDEIGRAEESRFPLYRRIVSPRAASLHFVGILEPGPRLPLVMELQSRWLAEHLAGRIPLPPPAEMARAIERAEPRTRRQFGMRGPGTVFCDGHTYVRLLRRDLRRAGAP
ncbi:MAG TPA: NAD(P)-binding domain-containing protein [Solirubrobacteraceae bacterium]|nr:NAD(P)-binding domain-containing protein [Solirubrobacteraceae bacterium]